MNRDNVCPDCEPFCYNHIWDYKDKEAKEFGCCYNCGLDMTHWNIEAEQLFECSLCAQPVKEYGKERHEEWHNPLQPFVTTNRILGRVVWSELQ